MVLVGAAIMPHAPIVLDPNSVNDDGVMDVYESCMEIVNSIRERQPHLVVIATPHGLCSSRSTASVYLNPSAAGTCTWKEQWSEYYVEANMDPDSARSLMTHLRANRCYVDGIEWGGRDGITPLSWSESVPLYFLKEVTESARVLVMSLGFPGSPNTLGEGRSKGAGGSLESISNSLLLGQSLGDWIDSPPNAERRIFVIASSNLAQAHAGVGCCPTSEAGGGEELFDRAYLNESSSIFDAGPASDDSAKYDACVEQWARSLRPDALMLGARKALPRAMPCGYEALVMLHGMLDGRDHNVWERNVWPVAVPTNMGVMCASYLPEWDALPSQVAATNTGYVRLPHGGGGIACSFSNAGKVCDVQGMCVETKCVKVEEEVAKRQREKERAERARLREERRQALVEAGEIGSDESITNSWEEENGDEEEDEDEDEGGEEGEEGRDNGGSSSKIIDRDVIESTQGKGAGETKDSAGSPKKGMVGSLFGGFKTMMSSSPAEQRHADVPRLNVSGFVAWLTVEKGKKPRNLAETLAQFGAIAVIVECDAAQWEEEEEEDAEGGPVPIVHVPVRKGERLVTEGSLEGNIIGVEFYRQLGGERARGAAPGWDSQLEQFGIVSSNLEPPQAPPPPEPATSLAERTDGGGVASMEQTGMLDGTWKRGSTGAVASPLRTNGDEEDGEAWEQSLDSILHQTAVVEALKAEVAEAKRVAREESLRALAAVQELESARAELPSLKLMSKAVEGLCLRQSDGGAVDAAVRSWGKAAAVVVAFTCRHNPWYTAASDDLEAEAILLSSNLLTAYAKRKVWRLRYLEQAARFKRFSGGASIPVGMGKGSLNLRASTPRAQASLPTAAPSQRSPLGTRAGFDSLKAPLAGSLSRPVKTLGLSRMILGGKPRPEREGIDQDLAASKALLSPLPMRVGIIGAFDNSTVVTLNGMGRLPKAMSKTR